MKVGGMHEMQFASPLHSGERGPGGEGRGT